MGSHPLNLAIRFLLEVVALVVIGIWGWRHEPTWLKYLLAIGLPVLAALVWGVFNVPDDPSRSGAAPVIVPGVVRLTIELVIFIVATWALFDMGYLKTSWVFGVLVVVHYLASYDRIIWLIKQ